MRYARTTVFLSLVLFAIAVAALVTRGLNLNVDFTGGTVIEVQFPKPTSPSAIRRLLVANRYTHARVENYGTASTAAKTVNEKLTWKSANTPSTITTSWIVAMMAPTAKRHSNRNVR